MMTYQMVFLRPGPNPDVPAGQQKAMQDEHLARLAELNQRRIAVLYGPFQGASDLRGIVILDVPTADAAREHLGDDPYVKAGHMAIEVKPWYGPRGWFHPPSEPREFERLVFGFLMPYGVFLVRQYFKTIPESIEHAARIDGAGTLTILWRVMVPMARPILGTLAVISFVNTWNNLLWPLIITHSESTRVISRGIAQMQSQFNQEYHLILAASAMALLPLVAVFLAFQRHIVRSIALSGMK